MSGMAITLMGYCFVDDSGVCLSAENSTTTAAELLPKFQAAVDCWEGVLRASGGGLELTKTFWHLIDHKWTGNKWEYHTVTDTPGKINLPKLDSEDRETVSWKEAFEASKTLGIFIAMDGNQTAQTDYLRQKGVDWADTFRTSSGLERKDAWEGFLTPIMSSFKYPATATTLTEAQWDEVITRCSKWALPSLVSPKCSLARLFSDPSFIKVWA